MLAQTRLSFADFHKNSLEETLKNVVAKRQALIVQFPDGAEVVIRPNLPLKPLPVLKGHVPAGWKEALYGQPD
jgi:hypothetical protein